MAIDATVAARPTPTPLTPLLCQTPIAGRTPPTPGGVPNPDPTTPRVKPGAPPHVGDVINLVDYFGLSGSTFLDAGGNFAPFDLSDPQRIAPIIAALDRESVVTNPPPGRPTDTILITIDVQGKPIVLGYLTQPDLIAFSVAGHAYATAAPPNFKGIWTQLICSRPR